jgi:hypothetical protein
MMANRTAAMTMENITRLTLMESKILALGKKQHDKGYQGGSFTPGFIRKETEYSYRAINSSLESLISQELVEKTTTSTFRNGALVELDVYTITNDGIQALEKVDSGTIKILGGDQGVTPPARHQSSPNYKPWEKSQPTSYPVRMEKSESSQNDLAQTVKSLETALRTLTEDLKALHLKVDRILLQPPQKPEIDTPALKVTKRKPRSINADNIQHRVMILKALNTLASKQKIVLAEDIKTPYFQKCEEQGFPPKGLTQFPSFLKRLQDEGLVTLKRVGCRSLGIKGQGARLVVTMTGEGEKFIAKQR